MPQCDILTANAVSINWQPPENDNGAPVTRYLLRGRAAGDEFVRYAA